MITESIQVASGILLRDDKALVCQRSLTSKNGPGIWEFPGGKLEPGENHKAAITRELKEELGIDVTYILPGYSLVPVTYNNTRFHVRFYRVLSWEGEPVCGPSHEEICWESLDGFPLDHHDRRAWNDLRSRGFLGSR